MRFTRHRFCLAVASRENAIHGGVLASGEIGIGALCLTVDPVIDPHNLLNRVYQST
jgi:hypothetical protein